MQKTIYEWLERDFVALRAEGDASLAVEEQTRTLFRRLEAELDILNLSLANTVRTRLWARDRASRDLGSRVRASVLTGAARSVSSSFIAPDYLDSDAQVAVELWAMRPLRPGAQKSLVEYDPPIMPLRYLVYDTVVALSGVTSVLPTLEEQVAEILTAIHGTLTEAGVTWADAVRISCTLHRSQSLDQLQLLLARAIHAPIPLVEFDFADGYSTEGKLLEIEVTAQQPA
jgi:enamine deaminase RidA (YjgF/YER057c/UK114 family)